MSRTLTRRPSSTLAFVASLALMLLAAEGPALAQVSAPMSPGLGGQAGPTSYAVAGEPGSQVIEFGAATFHGSLADTGVKENAVDLLATASGEGYWIVSGVGGVHPFGDASSFGSPAGLGLVQPVVGGAGTPSGAGYWLVANDGGVFAYGDATFFGSLGGLRLRQPIVGMAPTPTGEGYWLVAADGGVFAFGDAAFVGSTGAMSLRASVVELLPTPSGKGYWLIAADGGVFAFGDAIFHGSAAGWLFGQQIVSGAPAPDGAGYWMVTDGGAVGAFGSAIDHGDAAAGPEEPVVAIASRPDGDGYWLATAPGRSYVGPALPANSGFGLRIVYCNSCQRVWLVDANGRPTDSWLVSGRQGVPQPATYSVYSKSLRTSAGHDGISMEFMVRFAHGRSLPIGFHSIPVDGRGRPLQGEAELGDYRSSGCVRQRRSQAEQLYNWAGIGTTVVVLA